MKNHPTSAAIAALCLFWSAQTVSAHEYGALIKAEKYGEVEHAVNAKLAQDPNNADGLIGKVDLILSQGLEDRLDEAVTLGEKCVAAHPQVSECHEVFGNALGNKAVRAGILSAIGYAGKIRDAFKQAIVLDPQNLEARFSLLEYYMQAPGIVGGGTGKAQTLAAETAKINADASNLMLALLELADGKPAKAEAAALAVHPSANETIAGNQRGVLINVGSHYVQDKKYGDADRVFHQVQKLFPDNEAGAYGIARVLQEQGRHQDAIPAFEKALAIAQRPHIYYRMGQSWQALNDKIKAVMAFEKALSFKTGLVKKQKSDAESQLKTLKG
jgi:tetratricopeptide (TPR) repeat protein